MWALVVLALTASAVADCPRHCECKWRSGKESALCARSGLTGIPVRLPSTTQLLDFSENRLNLLRDEVFSNSGLVNLQRLYLTSCTIKTIRQNAFQNLVNLVELDLSRNRLEAVPSHAFSTIPELRELRLVGNPITIIKDEAFMKLTNLFKLSLSSCRIAEIESKSFVGLEKNLKYLELAKNRLEVIHVAALAPLRNLKGLELAGNPWDCSCALRPLRDWMIRQNVPATEVPECALPPRLLSLTWDRLELDDFACLPEVTAPMKQVIGTEESEVLLMCRVSGVPAPTVRWLRSGRLLANSTPTHLNPGRSFLLKSESQTSNLTIKNIDIQDAGLYTCAAENKAGKTEATINLVIDKQLIDKNFGGRALIAGVAVSAVVVLSMCLVYLCVNEIRKKKQLIRWNEQIVSNNRREENYEKIETGVNKNYSAEIPRVIVQSDNMNRKRGDYRHIPCDDPEEDRYLKRDTQPPSSSAATRWSIQYAPASTASWTRPHETDLHIPRFNDIVDITPESVPSSTSTGVIGVHLDRLSDDNGINNNLKSRLNIRAIPRDRLDNDLSGSDSEKNYPDLIEMSSLGTSSYLRSEKKHEKYFYTIPRKKDTDSRSPLLGSRRNSAGGDSATSVERCYEQIRSKQTGKRSNSFLDLASSNYRSQRNPSLPGSPHKEHNAPSATPLLDLSGLRDYSTMDSSIMDAYDFRASQLEKFLEEYRNLRDQLSKMKETRENLQRSRAAENEELRSVLKGRTSIAVTETSLGALGDAASPLSLGSGHNSRSEWISPLRYRN